MEIGLIIIIVGLLAKIGLLYVQNKTYKEYIKEAKELLPPADLTFLRKQFPRLPE